MFPVRLKTMCILHWTQCFINNSQVTVSLRMSVLLLISCLLDLPIIQGKCHNLQLPYGCADLSSGISVCATCLLLEMLLLFLSCRFIYNYEIFLFISGSTPCSKAYLFDSTVTHIPIFYNISMICLDCLFILDLSFYILYFQITQKSFAFVFKLLPISI